MSSCGLGHCEIIPMALIDVFGVLVTILHAVHELMIWLCFGDVQFSGMSSCVLAYCGVIPIRP
jgi:hypothetical protein